LRSWIGSGTFKIIVDMHNSGLSSLWMSIPFTTKLLNKATAVIVHNSEARTLALNRGISADRLFVLEDQIPTFDRPAKTAQTASERRMIIMPASFRSDEPIRQLLDAVSLVPGIDFIVTGPIERAEQRGLLNNLPPNVSFPGFLPTKEFDEL